MEVKCSRQWRPMLKAGLKSVLYIVFVLNMFKCVACLERRNVYMNVMKWPYIVVSAGRFIF